MELLKASKKIQSIVKQNRYMFDIPVKEVGEEIKKFCKENGINRDTEEYAAIMGMMRYEMKHWFDFALAVEILKGGEISELPLDEID